MQSSLFSNSLRAAIAAAIAIGATAGASASAQTSGEDAVAQCRSLLTDAARISCLEEALLGSRPTAQPATDAAAAAATGTPAPPAEPVLERRGGLRLPGIPFLGGNDDRPATTEVLVSSDDPAAEEFGAAMVTARQRAAGEAPPEVIERLTAAVASAKEVPYRRLEVVLDNGQVWRQIQADQPWDSRRYDEPEHVEIYASRLGGYRLHIPDTNLTLNVERVQ